MERYLRWESKIIKGLKNKPFASVLIFTGIIVLLFGATNYYRARRLSFNRVPPAVMESTEGIDTPVEILIPSLNLDIAVDPGSIKGGVWQTSANNATFLITSSPPGNGGNTVIYGHNLKNIFGSLPYVSTGQKIIIKTKSGKILSYIVDQKYFVSPDRVDLVSPSSESQLTVYTCWGLFDSQRAVIKAKPSEI